ncbi:MAG TPA: hypothetical protein GXX47_05540 [Firmicutes bacterium]|nr:hypothetical protein [Bacillota bacterium]
MEKRGEDSGFTVAAVLAAEQFRTSPLMAGAAAVRRTVSELQHYGGVSDGEQGKSTDLEHLELQQLGGEKRLVDAPTGIA